MSTSAIANGVVHLDMKAWMLPFFRAEMHINEGRHNGGNAWCWVVVSFGHKLWHHNGRCTHRLSPFACTSIHQWIIIKSVICRLAHSMSGDIMLMLDAKTQLKLNVAKCLRHPLQELQNVCVILVRGCNQAAHTNNSIKACLGPVNWSHNSYCQNRLGGTDCMFCNMTRRSRDVLEYLVSKDLCFSFAFSIS